MLSKRYFLGDVKQGLACRTVRGEAHSYRRGMHGNLYEAWFVILEGLFRDRRGTFLLDHVAQMRDPVMAQAASPHWRGTRHTLRRNPEVDRELASLSRNLTCVRFCRRRRKGPGRPVARGLTAAAAFSLEYNYLAHEISLQNRFSTL